MSSDLITRRLRSVRIKLREVMDLLDAMHVDDRARPYVAPDDGFALVPENELRAMYEAVRADSVTDDRRQLWTAYLQGMRPVERRWSHVDLALLEYLFLHGIADPFLHINDSRCGVFVPSKGMTVSTFQDRLAALVAPKLLPAPPPPDASGDNYNPNATVASTIDALSTARPHRAVGKGKR